jgi:hypothetical protein
MPLLANKWIVWGFIAATNLGMFFLLKMIAHATAWAFAVPYIVTFVLPVPIFVQVAARLRKWEAGKPPPKLLAACWGLAAAVFVAIINSAIFYFGARFRVFNPSLGEIIFVIGACTFSAGIGLYFQVLPMITARANMDRL